MDVLVPHIIPFFIDILLTSLLSNITLSIAAKFKTSKQGFYKLWSFRLNLGGNICKKKILLVQIS